MSLDELWLDYVALGGSLPAESICSRLAGHVPLDARQHDLLAIVVNERLIDMGLPRLVSLWDGGL